MKIVTTKQHRRNQIVTINGVTVKFDGDIKAEVTEKEFESIILKDDSISKIVDLPLKPLKTVDDKSKVEDLSEGKKADEGKPDEKQEVTDPNHSGNTEAINANTDTKTKTFAEELSEMKMGELKELAKEAKLPEAEWKGTKKKDDLITYLLSKIKE
jgi:hypothetical protein